MGSRACVSIHSCVHNFLRVSPLPLRQLSPSVTTTASGGQDSKGCGCSRRAACLRPLSPPPPRVKSGNGPGRRAKRQEEQRGMFKADLTLKAPGLTSKLQPLKPPAAEAFGTATLPESAGDPWVRRLRDDHVGCQPHVLLPSPAHPSLSPVSSPFFSLFAILQATSEATMKRSSNTAKMRGRRTLSPRPSLLETTEEAPVVDLPP